MEKIKSLVGKVVRIKREYIKNTNTLRWVDVGFYNEREDYCHQVYLDSVVPFSYLFETCDYDDCHDGNPLTWRGVVHAHLFGVDVTPSKNGKNISDYKPTHQIVLEAIGTYENPWTFAWDFKYFEVVREKTVTTTEWVVDKEFNNL
jgi:hypothetical protein